MEAIQVGEYIRTDKGTIGKVIEIRLGTNNEMKEFINVYILDNSMWTIENYIINHSFNIIDLIEVGDYVNGSKLLSIDYAEDEFGNCDKLHFYYQFEDSEKDVNEYCDKLVIKSIVTKEQFSNVEYKVEED